MSKNQYRSNYCSEIHNLVNQEVQLAGWVRKKRDHGNMIFIDLKDHTGIAQCTIDVDDVNFQNIDNLTLESVISITGTVIERPMSSVNESLETGKVEIKIHTIKTLSTSEILPFAMHQTDIGEELRLKYRFLDLRRDMMQNRLHLRFNVIKMIREFMENKGFIEIQTPILTSSSPEGARDYVVPSRLNPGKFYALPQAPQQFKQLLMVSGVHKYYQIAPCFRDEDTRADRAPGAFYQLDMEMAFSDQDEIFSILENLMHLIFKTFRPDMRISSIEDSDQSFNEQSSTISASACNNNAEPNKSACCNNTASHNAELNSSAENKCCSKKSNQCCNKKCSDNSNTEPYFQKFTTCKNENNTNCVESSFKGFKRIPYNEAMLKYGTDKPDLRINLQYEDATDLFKDNCPKFFESALAKGGKVLFLPVKGLSSQTRKFFDTMQKHAQDHGAVGLGYVLFSPEKRGPLAKFLSDEVCNAVLEHADGAFFVADSQENLKKYMNPVIKKIAEEMNMIDEKRYEFCWITDYPMFEMNNGKWEFSHNPFSMPQGEMDAFKSDPSEIKAFQYDLVCNGIEITSGAIRNHRIDVMYKAFEIAGYTNDDVDQEFGAMINAFRYGAPPHGGAAPGIDRIIMLLAETENIREVIPFPLNQQGQDLMMDAPSEISEKHLSELHIKLNNKHNVKN